MPIIRTYPLINETVTLVGGIVYTREIVDLTEKGFSIAISVNQGGGNLDATLILQAYNGDDTGWITEPLAVFNAHPAGIAMTSKDNFVDAFGKAYRIGISPNLGDGPVIIDLGY